jgi:serine/threonine protein kinase
MNFLHQHNPTIVHRDLRSPNIFLMTLDESAPIVAKVADFGVAHKILNSNGITDPLDTWQWVAPETLDHRTSALYDERSDVYSFGIVLWELSSRKHPFEAHSKASLFKVKEAICRGDLQTLLTNIVLTIYSRYRSTSASS